MAFTKSTVLPADPAAARQKLNALLSEPSLILLVVLGSGGDAQTLYERAVAQSGAPSEPFSVCWAKNPPDIQDILDGLQGQALGPAGSVRGFTLSSSHKVVEVFPTTKPVPDELKLLAAFPAAAAA